MRSTIPLCLVIKGDYNGQTADFIEPLLAEITARTGRPLPSCLPAVLQLLSQGLSDLRKGKIPPRYLVVSQTLSKPVTEYRVPSLAAVLQPLGVPEDELHNMLTATSPFARIKPLPAPFV